MPTCICIFPFYAGEIWPAVIISYLLILLVLLTLFCVSVVIFSLLSTDTAISEDFDDLRVP